MRRWEPHTLCVVSEAFSVEQTTVGSFSLEEPPQGMFGLVLTRWNDRQQPLGRGLEADIGSFVGAPCKACVG